MRAMPQAMEWSLATPITSPRLPCISLASAAMVSLALCWVLFRIGTADEGSGCPVQASCVTLEDQRRIGAAEAEAVGQRRLDPRVVDALAHDVRVGQDRIDLFDIRAL